MTALPSASVPEQAGDVPPRLVTDGHLLRMRQAAGVDRDPENALKRLAFEVGKVSLEFFAAACPRPELIECLVESFCRDTPEERPQRHLAEH